MRVVHRPGRALTALLLPLLLATCTEEPMAPRGPVGFAQLAVEANAPGTGQFAGLTIDFVQAVVTKPNPQLDKVDTLASKTVPFPPDANTINLGLTLLLSQSADTVDLTLNYLSGTALLFTGGQRIEVRQGPASANPVPTIPMLYVGPGANVTTLTVQPRDTILTEGASFQFGVTALDGQGASVPQFYVSWTSTSAGNAINAAGALRAGTSRTTFFVRAMTPDSVWDSTTVTVVPAPASLVLTSGDAQTAPVSTAPSLPLIVQVRGADILGVPGVRVTFAPGTGGGTVDTATVISGATGQAGTTVLLGPTAGQQTFTATVTGLPPVTFHITATPVIGPPSQLFLATAPSATAASGVPLVQQPVIQLRDASNQNVGQAGVAVTAALGGAGVLGGTTVVLTNASGQAVFTNLAITGTVGPRTLTFTSGSLTQATSGTITLGAGPAATLALQAGNGQSAVAGTAVAVPPAVIVTDGAGNPVSGVAVTWTAATGNGTVVPGSPVNTNGSGIAALTSWTLDPAPKINTLTATAGSLAGSPITFTANGTPPLGTIQWTGAVSTDWSVAGNWNPAQVPTAADNVVVPTGTPNNPLVSSTCAARSLTVTGTLSLGTNNCQVQGDVISSGVIAGTSGAIQVLAAGQVRGNFPNLVISAPVTVSGATGLSSGNGNLTITGVGASLTLNGQSVVVPGNLSVQGAGVLVMNNGADVLTVQGSAAFDGSNELGQLTAGTLTIVGNFAQNATSSADAFHSSGTHLTVFAGASPTVAFATPGNVPGSSHFEQFRWTGSGTLTLNSDVYAHGTVDGSPGVTGTIAGNGHKLQVGSFVTGAGVTMNNASLVIDQPAAVPLTLSRITFVNLPSTATQLTILHPGIPSGAVTLDQLSFSPVPTTGFYLTATDNAPADGATLVVNVTNSTPSSGAPFVQTSGATVAWPSGTALTWTGAVSTDWSVAGNWNPAQVPGPLDDVTIPATANRPSLTARSLAGQVSVSGNRLDLAGHALQVTRAFATSGTGFLTMQLAADSLIVGGDATFDGGSESGELTNGTLVVAGNFTQGRTTSPASFTPTGNHTTVFSGTAAQAITVPDTSLSFFHHLRIADNAVVNPQQVLQVQGDLTVGNNVTINATAPAANLPGFNVFGSVSGGAGGTLTASRLFVGGSLSVLGGYNVAFTTFTGAGQVAPIGLPYQTVTIYGTVSFAPGNLAIGNNLVVSLGAASLTLNGPTTVGGGVFIDSGTVVVNGQPLTVTGGLTTQGTGTLTMQNALDAVSVGGPASFGGGDETGRLTAGTLTVAGDFTQSSGTSGSSFLASGAHQAVLTGVSPTVTFATPGSLATQSRFAALTWTGTGTLTQGSGITITGTYSTTATTQVTNRGLIAGGRFLQFASHAASGPIVFDNIRVIVNQTGTGTPFSLNNATFQGLTSTVTQLTVQHPGTGSAITLSNLIFSVTPTGAGLYLSATDNNTGDGQALILDVVGASPASGDPYVQRINATVNWGAAPTSSWVGATAAWNLASNWAPAIVPTSTTDVLIPSGRPFAPQITVNTAVRNLTVAAGASIDIPSAILTVYGDVDVQGTVTVDALNGAFNAIGTGSTIRGTIQNVNVLGTYTVTGPLNVANDLLVQGTAGDLSVADQTVAVGRDLSLFSAGTVTMTNAAGVMTIGRNANFMGGNTAGHLTAGRMDVAGNLIQNNSGTGNPINSFSPSGSHVTRLTGSGVQQISICTFCTGTGTGFSHFANLDLSQMTGSADLIQFDRVYVEGTLISNPAVAPPTLTTSNTGQLQVGGVNVNGLVLNALPLTISGGTITAFNRVTLRGYAPTDIQLTINHPGAATPFVFDQLNFAATPTGAGRYLVATDADGATPNVLTINLTNPTPATDGGFVTANLPAVINWPATGPVVSWTGALSSAWTTGGNWSTGTAPSATDSVDIPSGAPNAPTLSGSTQVRSLTVQAGATLTVIDATLTVSDALGAAGQIVTTGGGMVSTGSTATTISGNLGSLTANGPVTLSGRTVIPGGGTLVVASGGNLTLNGQVLEVETFSTTGSGLLTMVFETDSLIVHGDATFNGGNETGHLTAGLLDVQRNFVQDTTTSPSSFTASSTHKTLLGGSGVGSISFASPGASGFQNLSIDPGDGTTRLISNLFVAGNFQGTGIGTIQLDSFVVAVYGSLDMTGPNFTSINGGLALSGNGTIQGDLSGSFPVVNGNYQLTGNVIGDTLTITNGDLMVNGHTLDLLSLDVVNTGTLTMTDPRDTVYAGDFANFSGGSTAGRLTNGVLILLGDFSEAPVGSPSAFAPSGNHLTIFGGPGVQNVNFFNPGAAASHFQNVLITSAAGGVTIDSAFVLGTAAFDAAVPTVLRVIHGTGANSRLVLSDLDISGATFDNLGVAMPADGSGTFTQFDNVTFQNYATDGMTLLTIVHPGAPATFNLINLTFNTTIGAGTSNYLSATDSDGGPPLLDLRVTSNLDPVDADAHTQRVNGATVTWQVP